MPRPPRLITFKGTTKTLTEWAHDLGLKIPTLHRRLAKGWTVEEALDPNLVDLSQPHDWSTREDLTGRRFFHLVVVSYERTTGFGHGGRRALWRVRCDCGQERVLDSSLIKSGRAKSCGCWQYKYIAQKTTTHGATAGGQRAPEFKIWSGIKSRCFNPRATSYERYGGRGITMHASWLGREGFAKFFAYLGPRPGPGYSIDRYPNPNGNYEPGNVRWATASQQIRNSSNTHVIEVNGVRKPIVEWSGELGIPANIISSRIYHGWPEAAAVTTPMGVPLNYVCVDLTGRRFGRLLVLGLVDLGESGRQRKTSLYRVRCDCGTEKAMPGNWLTHRVRPVVSCGCSRRQPHKKNRH